MLKTFASFTEQQLGGILTGIVKVTHKFESLISRNKAVYFYGFLSNLMQFIGRLYLQKHAKSLDWSLAHAIRGMVTTLLSLLIANQSNIALDKPEYPFAKLFRKNAILSLNQLLINFMVTVLPLALSMIIMNTGPMFTWLMTVFKFNAKVNKGDVIVAFLCFLSLILIGGSDILYHLIHGDLQKVLGEGQHWSEYVLKLVCVGIMIVGWILWACVRRVKDCYSIIINFHFGIQCWVQGILVFVFRQDQIAFPSWHDIFLAVLIMGVFQFIGQTLFFHGQTMCADVNRYNFVNYTSVFYSYVYQIWYQDKIPNYVEIIGILTLLTCFSYYIKSEPV